MNDEPQLQAYGAPSILGLMRNHADTFRKPFRLRGGLIDKPATRLGLSS
jgi:hypothetical protein